ncbi:MAG: DUF92 domain-containing protein [Anaerolineales bacterium]|nr:DUF92 domain-containing protein [Anaerolineales bacterium]
MFLLQLFGGFIFGITISMLAWRTHALTKDGAIAAAVVGTLIFGLGGLPWAALLLTFFITSSGLSRMFTKRKAGLHEKFSKGNRRDWGQVVANGGFGALLILVQATFPAQTWPWWAYAGALAAVNADTWATELGTLSKSSPRLITTGQKVEKGTSGGVSLTGTLAALTGAVLIGGVAALFPASAGTGTPVWHLPLVVSLAGLAGSLFDSLLGATVQAIYHCPTCVKETERHPNHTCGTPTHLIRGFPWLNNDGVNFAASFTGAIIAVILHTLL